MMNVNTEYYVYVFRSQRDEKRYVGISDDVQRRLNEHNSGKVRSTKSRTPFVLIYQEKVKNRSDARLREKYFKTAAGRRWLDRLETKLRIEQ